MKTCRLLSLGACALLLGCGSEADEVRTVAQAFWDASAAGDVELARSHVSESSTFKPDASDEADAGPSNVRLGDVELDGDEATVETVVSGLNEDAPVDIEFETAMVREHGEWKIDMDKTTGSMMQAAIAAMAEAMGEAFQGLAGGMAEGLAEGVAEAMKEGVGAMADSMEEGEKR